MALGIAPLPAGNESHHTASTVFRLHIFPLRCQKEPERQGNADSLSHPPGLPKQRQAGAVGYVARAFPTGEGPAHSPSSFTNPGHVQPISLWFVPY